MSDIRERIERPGPKRILALDGGGIKGVMTLEILRKIEEIVERKHGHARLSDHFDLIGGTSTGAIIAGALAIGKPVADIAKLYDQLGNQIFDTKWYRKGVFAAKFSSEPLRRALDDFFGDVRLDNEAIVTGLGVVAKRLDTGSIWIVHNSPHCVHWKYNREWRLRQLIRSSTAAPHYFEPEEVEVNAEDNVWGLFVDGGVSPHNNPSLQLLMLATLTGHGFGWRDRELSVTSVGTGFTEFGLDYEHRTGAKKVWHNLTHPMQTVLSTAAPQAVASLGSLMHDNACLVELMMQWFSDGSVSSKRAIDAEVGDLSSDLVPGLSRPAIGYRRYDAMFEKTWLGEKLGIAVTDKQVRALGQMDKPDSIKLLQQVGREVANRFVSADHF